MKLNILRGLAVAASLALACATGTVFFAPNKSAETNYIVLGLIVLCLAAAACAMHKKVLHIYLISPVLFVSLISLGPVIYFNYLLLVSAILMHIEMRGDRVIDRRQAVRNAIAIIAIIGALFGVLWWLNSAEGSGTVKIDDLPFQR
jgi:hypothetical protein